MSFLEGLSCVKRIRNLDFVSKIAFHTHGSYLQVNFVRQGWNSTHGHTEQG